MVCDLQLNTLSLTCLPAVELQVCTNCFKQQTNVYSKQAAGTGLRLFSENELYSWEQAAKGK